MRHVRRDVTITTGPDPIAAWCYEPVGPGPLRRPAVVLSHGFSAVKELGLDDYAAVFADAGYVVVAFDHPCFGGSGGEPRQDVDPDRQLAATAAVLGWVAGHDGVDPGAIGLWGTSFSGGHAVTLAATDDRVRAVVAQVPFLCPPADELPADLADVLALDEQQRAAGETPITIPVVTDDPAGFGALSPDPASFAFFRERAASAPSWRNEVTLASIGRLFGYRPIDVAAAVRAPVLLVAARDDVLAPFEFVGRAHAAMPSTCDLVELPGGHFDAYGEGFGLTSQAALGWFERWLQPSS
ncbi:MAG: alpha/beta fold hydrolase [Acidimicrobiales bacterium]